jgi:DMSO/TMAO reductase YedYZ molybdopterin-dependent catalytic subunit
MMPDRRSEGTEGFLTRRGFLRVLAASGAAAALPACAHLASYIPRARGFWPAPKAVTPFITPNEDFYIVAIDPTYRPPVDLGTVSSRWSLEFVGLSGVSHRIGYGELNDRARRTVHYTFECIGNPVGGQLIGNAAWRVVPIRELLAQVPGGLDGARSVMIEAMDGFYSSVSLERAMDDYAFLALDMNGVPLPAEHGFPVRVILPDLYGKKQPRWLKRITLLEDEDTTSYWERRFWKGSVAPKTTSRLDPREDVLARRPVELTGMAYAGARGIRGVEVSLDDGIHWVACELVTGERTHVWSLWRYVWPNPSPGRHALVVRAIDGTGEIQTARRKGRFPSGATGYHRMQVTAREGPQTL